MLLTTHRRTEKVSPFELLTEPKIIFLLVWIIKKHKSLKQLANPSRVSTNLWLKVRPEGLIYILQIVILLVKMLYRSLKLLDDGFVLLDVLILLQNCRLLVFNDMLKFFDFIVHFQVRNVFLTGDWGRGCSEERGWRLCEVGGGDREASLQGRGSAQAAAHPTQSPLTLVWHHSLLLLAVDKHLRGILMELSNS